MAKKAAKKAKRTAGTGRTAARIARQKGRFLEALKGCDGSVDAARRAVGVGRSTVYEWAKLDPTFAAAWDEIVEGELDIVEKNIMRRAKRGWLKPVWHNGVRVGVERVVDNRLSSWVLERRRKKYAPKASSASDISPEDYAKRVLEAFAAMDMLTGGEGHEAAS